MVNSIAKNNQRAANRRVSQNKSPNPPQLQATISHKHRFRFVVTNAGGINYALTANDFADLLCVATSANVAYRLWDSVRIRAIEMWCANSSGSSSNTVQVEYSSVGSYGGSTGITYNDTALGTANIAHVKTSPPPMSLASFWIGRTENTELVTITGPQGSVIDLVLEFAFNDTETPVLVTGTVSGATTGKMYCRPLPNSGGTAVAFPVGYDYV